MVQVSLQQKEGKYGIIQDGKEVIPFVYDDANGAIAEWEYFECLNAKNKFLDHQHNYEEIDILLNELKRQINPTDKNLMSYLSLQDYRTNNISLFHKDHVYLFAKATGSTHNHQNWEGGYYDHLKMCFDIAEKLYSSFKFRFSLQSALVVLYFHDVEKVERKKAFDKDDFYDRYLSEVYEIQFTSEERNALQYIHGEGEDYRKDHRVMNELAAFCHCCDVLSARCFFDLKNVDLK
jgi:hypothetical protein